MIRGTFPQMLATKALNVSRSTRLLSRPFLLQSLPPKQVSLTFPPGISANWKQRECWWGSSRVLSSRMVGFTPRANVRQNPEAGWQKGAESKSHRAQEEGREGVWARALATQKLILWTECLQAKRTTVKSRFPPKPAESRQNASKSRHIPPIPPSESPAESRRDYSFARGAHRQIQSSAHLEGSVRFQGDPWTRRDLHSAPLFTPFVGSTKMCSSQWNPKYGWKGTITTHFALIALVDWQYWLDSTLRKLFVHPKYGWNGTVSRVFPLIALVALGAFFHSTIRNSRITFHHFILSEFFLVIISSWFTSKNSGRIISRNLSDLHLLPHLFFASDICNNYIRKLWGNYFA